MKIQIESDITGTGKLIWGLDDGSDKFSGYTDTLGECFEEIVRQMTMNQLGYYND